MVPASDSKSSRRALDWQDACTPAAREAGKASSGFCEGSKVRQRENAPDAGNARQPERTADGPPSSLGAQPPPSSQLLLYGAHSPPSETSSYSLLTCHPSGPQNPPPHSTSRRAHARDASCTSAPLLSADSDLSHGTTTSGGADIYCAHTVRSCVVIPDPHPCREECLVSIPIYTRGNGSPDRLNISLGLPSPSLTVVP